MLIPQYIFFDYIQKNKTFMSVLSMVITLANENDCLLLVILIFHEFEMNHLVNKRGWSGGAKVLCILHHQGVQLILAYSWARPAILVVGKGRGGMFLFLLFLHFHSFTFIPVPLSSLSLSFISSTLSSISFLPFSGRRHKMTLKGWRVVKPQHNQSKNPVPLSSLSLSFISSTLSSISFLPFSGRWHKMTLKGWRVIKPQHNQSIKSTRTLVFMSVVTG